MLKGIDRHTPLNLPLIELGTDDVEGAPEPVYLRRCILGIIELDDEYPVLKFSMIVESLRLEYSPSYLDV